MRVGDPAQSCPGNHIQGTATFNHNTGGATVTVGGNTITGSLSCSANSAVTNDGSPNTVTGARTGQCAGL